MNKPLISIWGITPTHRNHIKCNIQKAINITTCRQVKILQKNKKIKNVLV
jgi:hypothetical protein